MSHVVVATGCPKRAAAAAVEVAVVLAGVRAVVLTPNNNPPSGPDGAEVVAGTVLFSVIPAGVDVATGACPNSWTGLMVALEVELADGAEGVPANEKENGADAVVGTLLTLNEKVDVEVGAEVVDGVPAAVLFTLNERDDARALVAGTVVAGALVAGVVVGAVNGAPVMGERVGADAVFGKEKLKLVAADAGADVAATAVDADVTVNAGTLFVVVATGNFSSVNATGVGAGDTMAAAGTAERVAGVGVAEAAGKAAKSDLTGADEVAGIEDVGAVENGFMVAAVEATDAVVT